MWKKVLHIVLLFAVAWPGPRFWVHTHEQFARNGALSSIGELELQSHLVGFHIQQPTETIPPLDQVHWHFAFCGNVGCTFQESAQVQFQNWHLDQRNFELVTSVEKWDFFPIRVLESEPNRVEIARNAREIGGEWPKAFHRSSIEFSIYNC